MWASMPRRVPFFLYSVLAILLVSFGNAAEQEQLRGAISTTPKRVAIIGAGAGGSFAAYQLRKLADEADLPINITVYERESYVGGRSTTVNVFDDPAYPIELGASIFVQINFNLVNASRDLGLTVSSADHARPREAEESIGIWDGSQFVFTLKNSYNWWNIGRLFWRYGLAPLRTQNLVKSVVGKFLRLYEEPLFPFSSLTEAAVAADLINATTSSGDLFLQASSIDSLFAREIIQASTRVNYGQNLQLIHGLESIVCMATDGAVSIKGGNWRIFDGALRASGANVKVNTTATEISRNDDGTVRVSSKLNTATDSEYEVFDEVVIAGPLQYSGISVSPPLEYTPDEIPYVNLHVTLFASPHRISPKYFGLQDSNARAPETILTTLPEGLDLGSTPDGVGPSGFWSISTLRTVDHSVVESEETQQHYIYKIFSPKRPTAEFIAQILGLESDTVGSNTTIGDLSIDDISWFHEKLWNPYPLLYPRVTFEETLLAPGVWYTGGIESFISTMETSALMGRNVATLMFQSWQKQGHQTDSDASIRDREL
ncbi:Prenylcysteine oxidase [Penicillium italicum]|uniref:Prenylcysteine oxidase n=1 Tax=Penicillium italicum TaxID=40296 RepID=A0A0A2KUC7_PENIT|nr:Prenylcysteine oxidase [Penicillium italicum]